jgi:serine O-acetyltransferase
MRATYGGIIKMKREKSEEDKVSKKQKTLWRQIGEDIRCVFDRDPSARTYFEIMTTYPGVHAIMIHRLANILWRHKWLYLSRLVSYISRIWTSIDIHPGAKIGRRLFIDHGTGVVIGETAEVGDDVTIYHGVTLGGVSWNRGKRHPTLGNKVVVGAGAKILGPIEIGDYAMVGANSVVISSVPEGKTVVGIPGKVVVKPSSSRNQEENEVDLNHHLIPDPVADAISCLLERIRLLEQEIASQHKLLSSQAPEIRCKQCDAQTLCEPKPPQREIAEAG